MTSPRRALLISYPFPPVGGAGVQRVTKFTKYLPQAGWLTSVLTVENPSVPLVDQSLGHDIPPETIVRRARTWEPSYSLKTAVSAGGGSGRQRRLSALPAAKAMVRRFANLVLQPDPQILWMPGAVRDGLKLLREVPHAAIVATGPPFSTFLIGAALSRRTKLPLILDYRDEWGLSNTLWENKRLDGLSTKIQMRMHQRVVRQAAALVATTKASAASLEAIRDQSGARAQVTCIYNGYDPDDFPGALADRLASDGRYRLVYAGTLWSLTSVEPLVEAALELARRRPDLAGRLELVFAGRRTGAQQSFLDRLSDSPCRVVELPYLDHSGAIELISSADGLCALLTDTPGAERVVPAKLFESMAAQKPIVMIAPAGEAWELLKPYPAAHVFDPKDIAGIANGLAGEIERTASGDDIDWSGWDGAQYERKNQARQLAAILDANQMDFQSVPLEPATASSAIA